MLMVAAVVYLLIAGLQKTIDDLRQDYLLREDRVFVPPMPRLVKSISLGYHNLVADYYWVRTIQYRETCREKQRPHRDLYAMTDFLTDLDPGICLAYFYTGLAMIEGGGDQHKIISILTKGGLAERCSHYWRAPFLLGYYYYFHLHDYQAAVPWMELACKRHNGHKLYCGLATRISSIAGAPELGLELIEEVFQINQDPLARYYLERRYLELNVKITERDLSAAAKRYYEARGVMPANLDDLFAEGPVIGSPPEGYRPRLYPAAPAHPMAGRIYLYDPDEQAVRSEPRVDLGVITPPQ